MGSLFSKEFSYSKNKYGSIRVRTEKDVYYAGEVVTGTIQVNIQ